MTEWSGQDAWDPYTRSRGASGCARGLDEGFRRGAGPFIYFRQLLNSLPSATRSEKR
jgi:hypothetical protein